MSVDAVLPGFWRFWFVRAWVIALRLALEVYRIVSFLDSGCVLVPEPESRKP